MTIKALLLADNNTTGSGLKSIRHTNAKMVDISAYASVLGTNLYFHIIYQNTVYLVIKQYVDLDKNQVILMAKEEIERYNELDDNSEGDDDDEDPNNNLSSSPVEINLDSIETYINENGIAEIVLDDSILVELVDSGEILNGLDDNGEIIDGLDDGDQD